MKKLLVLPLFLVLLSSCGISPQEMRNLPKQVYSSDKSRDELKSCLLDKLDEFRPDRISVNDFSDKTEIFIGAVQAGKLRNHYLFSIQNKQILLSKYDGYYTPLSINEAIGYIQSCSK
ncbi:hypothetical protein E4T80_11485 [Muribacter muris]|uniref:Lipoprotein n=1 Tax=Muribacter muris TaxID=67855 RepID=A0A4Y9JRK9_9PAST|nr:hypothetical protein [Muribacter muris]MBF0786085.1 hypothetical protein [Muribacter muris]MBF0826913.1 hypothetical protein [Muribacter muris]TFV07972.1 hypothetical protein E4T80_11485 [Muribacter muris]